MLHVLTRAKGRLALPGNESMAQLVSYMLVSYMHATGVVHANNWCRACTRKVLASRH